MNKFWTKLYPEGVVTDINVDQYGSLTQFFDESFAQFAHKECCTNMGVTYTYKKIDDTARHISAWLQARGIQSGAKIAVMMPNVNQYLPTLMGIVRGDYVLTSVNPLYTPRELKHQLIDSGATAIIILETFCHTLEKVIDDTQVETVIISKIGDMLGKPKGLIVDLAAKYIKKAIPDYNLSTTSHHEVVSFKSVISQGAKLPYTHPQQTMNDLAFLQYTGGTTGVSKGVLITHRNIMAATLQFAAWFNPAHDIIPDDDDINTIMALPLYHVFAFIMAMLGSRLGHHFTLITNPRDMDGFVKTLSKRPFHIFPAVNTLFQGLLTHPDFKSLNFSKLVISVAGGMAATQAVAEKWLAVTGCPVVEGWGMSETMGAGTANPVRNKEFTGNIGMPLPGIDISIRNDEGEELGIDEVGEMCIKGENVISRYHNLDDCQYFQYFQYFTEDGYLRSGDVAAINEKGHIKLFDRKKDMLIVSGFNVFPNEVEGVIGLHPKVAECGVVGVIDERQGDSVKAYIVKGDTSLTEGEVMAYCKENLTGYKRPKHIEFLAELPKSAVGKILRHKLRDM